jgi:hypothetical protein
MELEAYHRSLLALCFGPEGASPLAIYREMVRSRLLTMAKVAYSGAFALAGDELIARFERYLDESPPRTPHIREYIGEFARVAEELAPPLGSLVQFGAAKWRAAQAQEASEGSLREIDFEGELVLNGTLQVVEVPCSVVDGEGRELATPTDGPQALLIYRRPAQDDVRWFVTSALLARLLRLAQQQRASLGALLPVALDQLSLYADEALLEGLVSALTVAVERQVVLGVLEPGLE